MKKRLVVAHYNENLDWLEPYKNICDIMIYNKNNSLKNFDEFEKLSNGYNLLNIGREAHTYLWHIVHHYHELADIEIFVQGRIEDHIPLHIFNDILTNCHNYSFIDFSDKITLLTFEPEIYHVAKKGAFGNFTFLNLKNQWGKGGEDDPSTNPVCANWTEGNFIEGFYKEIFPNIPLPKYFKLHPHALFAVRKDIIHKLPLEKYELLLNKFNPKYYTLDLINGHHPYEFENFWALLFRTLESL